METQDDWKWKLMETHDDWKWKLRMTGNGNS
jgi:hypothetical protein